MEDKAIESCLITSTPSHVFNWRKKTQILVDKNHSEHDLQKLVLGSTFLKLTFRTHDLNLGFCRVKVYPKALNPNPESKRSASSSWLGHLMNEFLKVKSLSKTAMEGPSSLPKDQRAMYWRPLHTWHETQELNKPIFTCSPQKKSNQSLLDTS